MVKHFIHGKFVPRGINTGPPSGEILSLRGLSTVPIPSFIPLGNVPNHERIRVGTCIPPCAPTRQPPYAMRHTLSFVCVSLTLPAMRVFFRSKR